MNYNLAQWLTIGIILVCVLLILFKPQIKGWFANNKSDGFANPSITTSDSKFQDIGDSETDTAADSTPNDMPSTTTLPTTTTQSTNPNIPMLGDFTNYPWTAAGYIPLLDIIMTRILLLQVWLADMAELQTTGLPRATRQAESEATNSGVEIEPFEDLSDKLYPEIYPTFEDFFTAEFQNVPRLNIFIDKITNPDNPRQMTIILSSFAKPNWVVKIIKFYRPDKPDGQTLNEFINELSGDIPQNREGNSSNLVMNDEIGGLSTISMPIPLRAKFDSVRNRLGQYYINMTLEPDEAAAPGFYKTTLGILRFIAMEPVLVQLLYMNITDDETIEMLELDSQTSSGMDAESSSGFEKDNMLKPKLVPDTRRIGALGLANILGYKSSVIYNMTLLTTEKQYLPSGELGISLLVNHTEQIKKLAKQAILQNPNIGTAVPQQFIIEQITPITDNIYSYYFDIDRRYSGKYGVAFTKSSIFQSRLKPFLFPLYADFPIFSELLSEKETELKEGAGTLSAEKKLALEKEIDIIYKNMRSLETNTPYMLYLPIYDFQYIKIVPRITKGELPVPTTSNYPSRKDKFLGVSLLGSKRKTIPALPKLLGKKKKKKFF